MRTLVLAMLTLSGACAGDDARHGPQAPAPAAATAPAPARSAAAVPAVPAVPAVAAAPAAPAEDPRLATRRTAHQVLAQYCGECHEGHRSTAVAKALAAFDLDQPDWPARFDDHLFASALKRLASKSDAARDAFVAFRDAERAAMAPR